MQMPDPFSLEKVHMFEVGQLKMVTDAGFQVTFMERKINGHAPFPHMPPWYVYHLEGGKKITLGLIVSCYHLNYKDTGYSGDLYPERPQKTGGPTCLEVDEAEMKIALQRLYERLYK